MVPFQTMGLKCIEIYILHFNPCLCYPQALKGLKKIIELINSLIQFLVLLEFKI